MLAAAGSFDPLVGGRGTVMRPAEQTQNVLLDE
jgi:hypothetical protein